MSPDDSSRPEPRSATPTSQTRLAPIVTVGLCLLLLALALAGARNYRDLARAELREAVLLGDVRETRERIVTLESRIERLESDPVFLERVAREELGWASPGDVVIVLPEAEVSPEAAAEPRLEEP